MIDFAPFLSKTLIGSHGQDLLIEGKVGGDQRHRLIILDFPPPSPGGIVIMMLIDKLLQ